MNSYFEKMECCAAQASNADEASYTSLIALLGDENWRVRYAAAIALEDRRDPRAIAPLLQALQAEEQAPLFSQPTLEGGAHAGSNIAFSVIFPPGTTDESKEAWRRRGRVMQAICLALGAIGKPSPAVLAALHRYAIAQECDYAVRAAACKALGQLAQPESLPILTQAARDEEWCTGCEARKAIKIIQGKMG